MYIFYLFYIFFINTLFYDEKIWYNNLKAKALRCKFRFADKVSDFAKQNPETLRFGK